MNTTAYDETTQEGIRQLNGQVVTEDGRFWDYLIGGALIITAVALAIYTAPVWIVATIALIGISFIMEGKPLEDGTQQSLASQLWDSSQTLAQNASNFISWLADSSIITWLVIIAIIGAIWYFTKSDQGSEKLSGWREQIRQLLGD